MCINTDGMTAMMNRDDANGIVSDEDEYRPFYWYDAKYNIPDECVFY